jgi:ATP-dependent helicase HrpA
MLLQARCEKVLPEMLIIAAGLSIPDPRERPEDAKEAAAAAHKVFVNPDSDFLSLLNIWRAAPDAETRSSGNALRRFCKANFLSLSRMREWRDVHRQLTDAMDEDARPNQKAEEASYPAIHRAVLSGLLGQIALRQEKNNYKASGDRLVTLFPGSNLYERREKPRKGEGASPSKEKSRQAQWIVAGEIVETSQLFARTVAGINPEWVIELGEHLCNFRYTEPHWSAKAGRVLVLERVLVSGLEVARRNVDFGRIDPAKATELFIRGALVAEEARLPHHFFVENRKVREKIETALTRVRSRRAHDLDESIFQFYAARLENVSSVHDLNRWVRERIGQEPNLLCATEADLIGDDEATYDRTLFPDHVSLGHTALPVTYAYTPGHESDGVTVRVPLPVAAQLTTGQIQWMVPGLREEQIGVLVRALPKTVRKTLMPLEPKIRETAAEFEPGRADFFTALADFLSRKYRVLVRAEDFSAQSLPAHLQPRVEVVDRGNKTVVAGRDLEAIRSKVENHDVRSEAWEKAVRQLERRAMTNWSVGDLPASVVVEKVGGAALLAYPGLALREGEVDVRLFRKADEAERSSGPAARRLAELVLARDLGRVWKDLASFAKYLPSSASKQPAGFHAALHQMSAKLQPPAAAFTTPEVLQKSAYEHLLQYALQLTPIFPLTEARFLAMAESARRELPALTYQLGERTRQILDLRQKLLASPKRYAGFEKDLERLVPGDFLARTPHAQLPHLFRYLRAVQIRAERATLSPTKDAEKAKQLTPFSGWENHVPEPQREAFRWLLEEFRVSLFAQELGTAQPASAQRLKALGGL